MQQLKFFTLLRTLDEKEIASFHRYLKQIHGNEQIALSLFAYLLKFFPGFQDEKKLEMDYAYRKIFKTDIGNDRKKILNTLSDLHLWLKNFLLSEKVTSTSFESQAVWLTILRERGLGVEFSRQVSRLGTEVSALPKRDVSDYMKDMAVHYFSYYHVIHDDLDADSKALRQYEASLDLYYTVAKLKIACERANRKNVLSLSSDPEILSVNLNDSGTYTQDKQPLLLLYREVYRLVALHQEESYDRLEAMLPSFVDSIAPDEMKRMIIYLYNYASAQVRKKRNEFCIKTHWLNKFCIEHSFFLQTRSMSATQFNNIVNAACNAHDVDWASRFVEEQSRFLPEVLRGDAETLAKAIILFEKKEFNQVLVVLENKDFREFFDNLRFRTLIIRSHYELGTDDSDLLDICTAFEKFLKRYDKEKKIEAVAATSRFIQILKMLIRKNVDKSQIIKAIEEPEPLFFDTWLLGKTKRYKKLF